ncbi:MAG: ABC transporter transmembrane domain-containing protein, partial [Mangrovibacterium sp.]
MKDLIRLLRRFLPPYKGKVALNFLFNLLAAIFGAFSFTLLGPVLGILFGTAQEVRELHPFEFTVESIGNRLAYFITWVMDSLGKPTALIYIGLFIILMVLLKTGFTYLASYAMIGIRNGVVRDIRSRIYRKMVSLSLGFFTDERKGDIM